MVEGENEKGEEGWMDRKMHHTSFGIEGGLVIYGKNDKEIL